MFANLNTLQNAKLFVSTTAAGGPVIYNRGLLNGTYGWWIRMPLIVSYNGGNAPGGLQLMVQVLVIRVSTLNNLNGVAIQNIIITKNTNNVTAVNG